MKREWLIRSGSKRGLWIPWSIELLQEAELDILLASLAAANLTNEEISGVARIQEKAEPNNFFVSDVIIPYQKCSRFHTDFLGEEMSRILEELEKGGKNPLEYNFWWHSHVRSSARFSEDTDETMIRNRLKSVMLTSVHARFYPNVPDETTAGPFFSLVVNIFGDMTARCDFVHRYQEEYRFFTFFIHLIRPFSEFSKDEQYRLKKARYPEILKIVRERLG